LARKQPQKKSKMKAVAARAIATPSNAYNISYNTDALIEE